AAGGIGTASIQLAKVLGARVVAVVSSDAKAQIAPDAGADDVVRVDGFKDAVKELTGGVDVVVDPVGGDRFIDSLRCLRPEGRMLVIGFTGGEIPTVKVNRLLLNNTAVIGVSWGHYWMPHPEYLQRQSDELWPHLSARALDALPAPGVQAAGHRLHRWRDPHREGQPAAAEQHRGDRCRLGALLDAAPGVPAAAVGRAVAPPVRGRARPADRFAVPVLRGRQGLADAGRARRTGQGGARRPLSRRPAARRRTSTAATSARCC